MKYKRLNAVCASIIIHLIFAFLIGLFLSKHYWGLDDNAIDVEFVHLSKTRDRTIQKHRTSVHRTKQQQVDPTPVHLPSISQLPKTRAQFQNTTPIHKTDVLNQTDPAALRPGLSVASPQTRTPQHTLNFQQRNRTNVSGTPTASPSDNRDLESFPPIKSHSRTLTRPKSSTPLKEGFIDLHDPHGPDRNPSEKLKTTLENPALLPQGELGAILEGIGEDIRGHIRIVRLKHTLSDWWQDPTALPALMKWMDKHTTIRLDMNFQGGSLRLTDPKILDAPLIVMTGHDKDITVGRGLAKDGPLQSTFSDQERASLRKYIIDKGGMLFFDDCGFHGLFAHIVADELAQIFPEYPLEIIPHEHEIYSTYYHLSKPPTGGDVFWGNENNAQPSQFRFQKGIFIDNRLAVVYNRKDYLCAMETAEIQSRTMLRLRRSPDVYRFMTNLMIYALKSGGNTDRSGYKE